MNPSLYPTRAALAAAVTHSLKNDPLADFRRDLDKALESADHLMAGHFMGRYWAERAAAPLRDLGCAFEIERISDAEPRFRVIWAGALQTA